MEMLIGTYEVKLDGKGRIALPVAIKKQMSSYMASGFILKRSVFQKCLELIPIHQWNTIMQKINKLNRFIKKNNDFIRLYTSGVKSVESDSTGRVLISKDLIEYAKLKKEIVLSSSVNILEIWDKALYEKTIFESVDEFANLAEEVMGTTNIENVS